LPDHRDDSTFSFDPSNLDVKTLEKDNQKRKIDARKGILLASYAKKKTRKRKKTKPKSDASQVEATTAVAAAADSSKCSSPKEIFALMPERKSTPQRPMELHIPGLDEHVPSRLPSPHSTESSRAREADCEAKVTDHLHPNAVGEPKTINSSRD
jgi:hypothetical protein